MNVEQAWVELEDRAAEWTDSLFRHHAGWDVATSEIERQAEAMRVVAETLAPSCRQDLEAWPSLSDILRLAQLTPIELEIRRLNEEHFTFEDILPDGQPVTP